LSRAEPNINNILPSKKKSCEDLLGEKSVFKAKLDKDINFSFIKKSHEGLTEKEEEETKKEESFMVPPTRITEKKILKGGLQYFELFFSII